MPYSSHKSRPTRRREHGPCRLLEPLESRLLLAANLTLKNILVVNSSNVVIPNPTVGDMLLFRAEYTMTDLTPANTFIVRFTLDGVALDSNAITGSTGVNQFYWYRGGWYATAGAHSVTVTVDGLNTVAETSEADNSQTFNFSTSAPVDLPAKFVLPLAGRQGEDWSVVNYVDQDPRNGFWADYLGGAYTYDGHNGIDLSLASFARMDIGLPAVAAAAGTVVQVQDGNFDRNFSQQNVPANYVQIDHGNGWSTFYYHFSLNTTTVKLGDKVVAGQILGIVGSSGFSDLDHLHFEVTHNGSPVDTFFLPSTFWHQPITYENSSTPRIMYSGVSNRSLPAVEIYERPSDVSLFPTSQSWQIWYWFVASHVRSTDFITVNWLRPNGTIAFFSNSSGPATPLRGGYYTWFLNSSGYAATTGTWQVQTLINGVEADRRSFTVTVDSGAPELRLYQGSNYIIDGRTTPFAFGNIVQNTPGPSLTFSVFNQGATPLTLSSITLPPGFSLNGALPGPIAANTSASFMIRMDTAVSGAKAGTVHLFTNDDDEADFTLNVFGSVAGAIPTGRPTLALTIPATAYLPGAGPLLIEPLATLTDPNSLNFNTGNLLVELAGNGTSTDVLSIASIGTAAGQISTNGTQVLFAGALIGASAGGTNLTPLQITLNASATVAAVQALLRAITYHNTTQRPDIRRRYIRFTLTDNTGIVSNMLMKTILINVFPYGKYTNVLTRSFYYRGSTFDVGGHDNAIAPFQTALLPGMPASKTHYTNYSRGINGLIIDIAGAGVLSPSDFILRVGNDNNPAAWALAPAATFTFRPGQGVDGSTRVELSWPDNLIENKWLQLTILANANTHLPYEDVSYFGNAIGDTADSATNTRVTSADVIRARSHPGITGATALIDSPFDFNRDATVNAADQTIARTHATTFLNAPLLLHLLSPNQAAPFVAPLIMMSAAPPSSVQEIPLLTISSTLHQPDIRRQITRIPSIKILPLAGKVLTILPVSEKANPKSTPSNPVSLRSLKSQRASSWSFASSSLRVEDHPLSN